MTIHLDYTDDAQLVAKCREIIAALDTPRFWTVTELAGHAARSIGSVSRSLHRASCPPSRRIVGDKGRIIRVEVTDELLEYLRAR